MRFSKFRSSPQVLMGVITVVTGFSMMWGSTVGTHASRTTYSALTARALDIDPSVPNPANNGRVVVAAAALTSDQQLGDEFLKPGPYLVLKRHVEMFQWAEDSSRSAKPDYELGWHEGQSDFFSFRVPEGHANPLLKIKPVDLLAENPRFGGFSGSKIVAAITRLKRLAIEPGMLAGTGTTTDGKYILIPREAGGIGPKLGDVRVWYEYLAAGEYTVLAVQRDEMTLLGGTPSDDLIVRPGRFDARQIAGDMAEESEDTFNGLLYLGAGAFFVGVFTLLQRFYPQINLRPHLAADGPLAALVVSGGITFIVMALFMILGMVG